MHYRYPLQKIVDLKSNEKVQAEWQLSQSMGRLQQEEAELQSLKREKETARQAMLLPDLKTVAFQIRSTQQYIDHLERRIEHKHDDVNQARTQVSQRQQALMLRMVDEKVWTTASDKAFRQFISDFQKKEQKELDEIASVRHGMKS